MDKQKEYYNNHLKLQKDKLILRHKLVSEINIDHYIFNNINICKINSYNNNNMFNNEIQFRDYIISNLNIIENGLKLINKEYQIGKGKIDILAKDINEKICLIELKYRKYYNIKTIDNGKFQLLKYYNEFNNFFMNFNIRYNFRLILIININDYMNLYEYNNNGYLINKN